MIYFFTPYSFNKKLFDAYDNCFKLLKDDDWACLLDGDTCFFENNFGHQIQEYIDKYPGTGMFVSYASRSAYQYMVPKDTNQESDSIAYHRRRSAEIYKNLHGQIKQIDRHVSGHLMCLKKSTWMAIRNEIIYRCDGANLLGVDTQITNVLIENGYKILLMRGIYLFHYYRLLEGKNYKGHLMDQTINILIRTSNREILFKRCLDSVRNQTYKNIRIFVSADDDSTADYVKKYGLDPVRVEKRPKNEIETAPWNAYLNKLIDQVKGGWIYFLDDDDYLENAHVLDELVTYLTDDNVIYFVRMKWSTGRVIPSDQNFNAKQAVRKDIGMPCFIFHAKHKHKLSFRPVKQGDFDYISRLVHIVKRHRWINIILTHIGNTGANGKPESELN
jgi:GT2 family glycosyltransferase